MSRITIREAYDISSEKVSYSAGASDETKASEKSKAMVARNASLQSRIADIDEPLEAFTILCAYFSGQAFREMEEKITEYEDAKEDYERVLDASIKGNVYLSEAHAAKAKGEVEPTIDKEFLEDINWVLEDTGKTYDDISKDYDLDEDEAQFFLDSFDKKKNILSADLEALSTEVDMAVQDQSEAEEMAANAVKKLNDLMSTIGKTAGG